MAENTYRVNQEKGRQKSFFARIESLFGGKKLVEEGFPVQLLPRVLFVFLLVLLYIWNTHNAEKNIRQVMTLEKEVEDLRADYTTLKAEFMLSGKQSEVAQKVQRLGLKESLEPPTKLIEKE